MSDNLNFLIPEYKEKIELLLQNLSDHKIKMIPTEGLRDPFIQAIYWRQSRSSLEVSRKIT